MTQGTSLLTRVVTLLTLAALALSALPTGNVLAAGLHQDPQPGRGRALALRLERVFHRQQERYERQGRLLERLPAVVERIQDLIDRASGMGYDASAVQTALDNFSAAVPAAQAAHGLAGDLIAAHAGFDDNGRVTDATAAAGTVQGVRDAFRTFVDTLMPPFIELRKAIRTFFDENDLRGKLRPSATATP